MNPYSLLTTAVTAGASDLLLSVGQPPALRIAGQLRLIPQPTDLQTVHVEALPPVMPGDALSADDIQSFLDVVRPLNPDGQSPSTDKDFSRDSEHFPARLRINISRDHQGPIVTVRFLQRQLRDAATLGIPQSIINRVQQRVPGLLVVSGPTDAGKSTTIASVVAETLQQQALHVITLEDPVEYLIPAGKGMVNQREVPKEAFATELEAALRQVPDLIVIGELRGPKTMQAALDAAESGHLVLASMHARGSTDALQRIVAAFPDHARSGVLQQLSSALVSSLHQRLLPRARKINERVLVTEVLHGVSRVRSSLRQGDFPALNNVMQTGNSDEMYTLRHKLHDLSTHVDPSAAMRLTEEINDR